MAVLWPLMPATTLLLLTHCAHNSEYNSNKYLFSSFNGVDLLHSMSADCCIRESGPKNVIFSNGPKIIFECSNPFY